MIWSGFHPSRLAVASARTVGVPAGVRGLAVEVAYTAVHLSLYPWGLIDEVLRPAGTFVHHRTEKLAPFLDDAQLREAA